MSELIKFAKREFEILGWPGEDEMQKLICDQVIELLEVFSKHGHSGSSAPYAIGLFQRLARFEPLSPLTGNDNEWNDVGHDLWQNKRNSRVFKRKDGKAYDIEGIVFREKNGSCYTNGNSHVFINFPYVPKTKYVSVQKDVSIG